MLKAIKVRARWNIARFVYVYLQEYFPRLFHVFIYREILGPIKLNMVMITLYGNFYQNHLRLANKLREKNTNILKSCQCTVYYHCWDLGKKDSLLVVKRYRISSVTFAPIFDVRARFKMPKREPKTKVKKHQVEELSLLVNGLSFSSLDVGSIRDAIQKLDARLEENTAR